MPPRRHCCSGTILYLIGSWVAREMIVSCTTSSFLASIHPLYQRMVLGSDPAHPVSIPARSGSPTKELGCPDVATEDQYPSYIGCNMM